MTECTAAKHGLTKHYRRTYGCICMSLDEVNILRAMRGEAKASELTRLERRIVVAKLTDQGRSQAEIAERVRMAKRSVCRVRARVRELSAA